MEMKKDVTYYESPLCLIKIMASGKGITELSLVAKAGKSTGENIFLTDCIKQLDEYFNKERKIFSLPLDLQGTDFQKKVWNELLTIPFGKTISYLQLAINLGDKKCIRAAGTANGKNPIAIIVPCHRVIGSNGSLVGYAGGLDKKKWLLEYEGVIKQKELF